MADLSEVSRLRLSSAKRRVDAFMEQIEALKASNFPHGDGKLALDEIEHAFATQKRFFEVANDVSDASIDQACFQIAIQISQYTQILGFILRSTNVRNPFELHFAFQGLIAAAIGPDVRVLISSEWEATPFTYAMSAPALPDFVLIGIPATESGNVLLVPVAGHEIGHTAWLRYQCEATFARRANEEVEEAFRRHPQIAGTLTGQAKLEGFGLRAIRDRCAKFVMQQIEETFSDLFGLLVFGASYLYAYDYLLAPGSPDRQLDYPGDGARMEVMITAAGENGITVDPALSERWRGASFANGDADMGKIVDEAASRLLPELKAELLQQLEKRGIQPPDAKAVAAVRRAFERNEPFSERASMAEIVTAGWGVLRSAGGLSDETERRHYEVLGDLMLKSIEVSEFLDRTTHA